MRLRLHTRCQNSAGQRVRIVLNLKGVAYEYVAIPSLRNDAFRELSPHGLMPVLEVDGHAVVQSLAIVELLEELFPEPSVLPVEPIARAEARAFANAIACDLHPLNNHRVRRYLAEELSADEHETIAWYRHWIARSFAGLEASLARRPQEHRFCFASQPTMADAFLVPQMDNARRFDRDLSPYPRLCAKDAACRKLDAFIAAAPETQPDYPDGSR